MKRQIVGVCSIIFAVAAAAQLGEDDRVKLSTGFSLDVAKLFNSSHVRAADITDSTWMNEFPNIIVSSRIGMRAQVTERLILRFVLEAGEWYRFPGDLSEDPELSRSAYAAMRDAHAEHLFGNPYDPAATLDVGYFPFNYASEVKTLGAYLFKSGTYPGFVISGDGEWRLAGLHFATRFPAMLTHDILLTSEIHFMPRNDISLSYILGYDNDAFVKAQAGVMLDRLLSVDRELTSPRNAHPHVLFNHADTVGGDTIWYSKAGTKLMARAMLDFQKLVYSDRLGPNDLRLYAEAAVLGVKNYDRWYSKIEERIPVMVGFNLPAFKLLDVLAAEVEYYRSPWRNNPYSDDYGGIPIPIRSFNDNLYEGEGVLESPLEDPGRGGGHDDDLKWAIYARKTLFERLDITARIASDHYRLVQGGGEVDATERLYAPDEFYTQLIVAVTF